MRDVTSEMPGSEAFEHWRLIAEAGDAEGQYRLGECYDIGIGVPTSYKRAVKWYTMAARSGHAKAQFIMGECSVQAAAAAKWYRAAAEQGHVDAQFALGTCYYFGNGVRENDFESAFWLHKASESGHMAASRNLQQLLTHLAKTTGECCATEAFNIGYNFHFGDGTAPDEAAAMKWYRKAAKQGHVGAMYMLGECCEEPNKAIRWYVRAARAGHVDAMYEVANCLYEVGEDEMALTWYERAAGAGHVDAMYMAGTMYDHKGCHLLGDWKWCRTAAELEHVDAQYVLGNLHRNSNSAVKWYRRAAVRGHACSILALADLARAQLGRDELLEPESASRLRCFYHELSSKVSDQLDEEDGWLLLEKGILEFDHQINSELNVD